jgi:hypothetical protein
LQIQRFALPRHALGSTTMRQASDVVKDASSTGCPGCDKTERFAPTTGRIGRLHDIDGVCEHPRHSNAWLSERFAPER